jgi:hypothetical protein
MSGRRLELAGTVNGQLTVIEPVYIHGVRGWVCQCICGRKCAYTTGEIRGGVKSCGCIHDVGMHEANRRNQRGRYERYRRLREGGMTPTEIARLCGVSDAAVHQTLRYRPKAPRLPAD